MLEYLLIKPTAYLDEIAWHIRDTTGKVLSIMSVLRALHRRN
jgi:hypothetical protein